MTDVLPVPAAAFRPPCPVCEKSTEGGIEVMLSIRFPITGVVHRGIMHVDCAAAALAEVKALALHRVQPASVVEPS